MFSDSNATDFYVGASLKLKFHQPIGKLKNIKKAT